MTELDTIVIGAGPAGATTARLLAERGVRTLLLEARRLPRDKLCGGGLTPKAQALLPRSALATVVSRIDRTELRDSWLPPLTLAHPQASVALVERERFDLALVEAAAHAGAAVVDGTLVRALREDAAGVLVVTDRARLRAATVVVASGEPTRLARDVDLGGPPRQRALALERRLPPAPGRGPSTAILEMAVRGGYAWYFPKADHASVGIGSHRELSAARLHVNLDRFTRSLGLDPTAAPLRGHWIAQGLRVGPLASRRVILAGDAAATADSLFGEGISYAIASGAVAAQTIGLWASGRIADLHPYDARLRGMLGPALGRLGLAGRLVDAVPSLALLALRGSAAARSAAIEAMAGCRPPFDLTHSCWLGCTCPLVDEPFWTRPSLGEPLPA